MTNPYQSPSTTETDSKISWKVINDHLTKAEKRRFHIRGALYGVWCATTIALPIQAIVMGLVTGSYRWLAICAPLIVLHLICIPVFQKSQRRLLADTEWARANAIRPEAISMSPFVSRQ